MRWLQGMTAVIREMGLNPVFLRSTPAAGGTGPTQRREARWIGRQTQRTGGTAQKFSGGRV